jgi:choline kinase
LTSKNDLVIGVDLDWKKSYEKRTDNSPIVSDFVAIKNENIMRLCSGLKEFNEEYKIAEFIGLMKLSSEGSKIITEKLTTLGKNHVGKFHDAISFEKAKIIDLLQELHESKIKIEPINVKGKWCEIDTIQDLEIARRIFN